MNHSFGPSVSRRSFLAGAAASLVRPPAWIPTDSGLCMHWRLNDSGDSAREAVSGTDHRIASRTGHAVWVGDGRERALRLDGYSVWVEQSTSELDLGEGPITACGWIALEAYPVNTAAIVQVGGRKPTEFRLCIDKWGYPRLAATSTNYQRGIVADQKLSRGRWVHLCGTCSKSGDLALFVDGAKCQTVICEAETIGKKPNPSLLIGKCDDSPLMGDIFPTGVLNGLLKDVRVYRAQLTVDSLLAVLSEAKPESEPDLQINRDWCGDDRQRPKYHALPPRAWTNEPHGLVYFKGRHHLFYQKNGNGPYWGNINWGHLTSPDLRNWTEMPVALSPEPGPDAAGCWSGSVVEYEGELAILYTGGDGHRASICLATSSDGSHFTKYHGNPVIPGPPDKGGFPEFRDPFVWREGDGYYAIVGSAVKDVGGTVLLFRSSDLIRWEFKKPLLIGDRESSGVFWEMPIFVKLGDKYVLIVCEVPGRASYWVGTWKDEVFTPSRLEPRRLELFNHLLSPTPHITVEGEVITMGIIPDQRPRKECWRAGWAHLYSLPRRLSLDSAGRLEQKPWRGLYKWEGDQLKLTELRLRNGVIHCLNGASGSHLRLRATIERETSQSVELILRRSSDDRERTVLRYDWETGKLALDRTKSSLDPEVIRDLQETTYFPNQGDILQIDVYLDSSVIEAFLDERAAFACRIYPTLEDSEGLALSSLGGDACVRSITIANVGTHA